MSIRFVGAGRWWLLEPKRDPNGPTLAGGQS
jgi:hypothetical protein